MSRQILSRAGLLVALIVAVAAIAAGCNGMQVEPGPLVEEDRGHSPANNN